MRMKHTKFILLLTFLNLFQAAQAQMDTEPERIKKYMKKEDGKIGLWDKTNKKWLVEPEYFKITGVLLSSKNYDVQNKIFFKLWKGNTFDLLRVTVNTSNYSDEFEIWVKDITDFKTSNLYFDNASADWYNFVFFRKKGKWGWFVNKVEVLQNGRFSKEENVLVEPGLDTTPLVSTYASKQFYTISPNNYVLLVNSGKLTGLYSLAGKLLMPPGPYTGFKLPESIDYGKELYVESIGPDNLIGYALNGVSVPPQYTAIKKERHYLLNFDYYDCTLPGGEHEIRRGTELISKVQLQAMEDAHKNKAMQAEADLQEQKAAAFRQEMKILIAESSGLNPFEVAKIVGRGSLEDLLLYCKKFGLEYTISVKNDMREYTANEPFEFGVKSFTDAGKDGLIAEFVFKDSEQKQAFISQFKEKGFQDKQLTAATGLMSDGSTDIWFFMGSNKWQISKSR